MALECGRINIGHSRITGTEKGVEINFCIIKQGVVCQRLVENPQRQTEILQILEMFLSGKGRTHAKKKNARNKLLVVSTRNIPPASNRGEEGRRGKNTVLCQSLKVLIETNVIYKGL